MKNSNTSRSIQSHIKLAHRPTSYIGNHHGNKNRPLQSVIVAQQPGYNTSKEHKPQKEQKDAHPKQVNARRTDGWRSPSLTFSTTPINPDLYTHPNHRYELVQHPTQQTHKHTHTHTHTHTQTHTQHFIDQTAQPYAQ